MKRQDRIAEKMMEFFERLDENRLYRKIMINPWSYTTGAILLALLALTHIAVLETSWVVSGSFTVWGGKLLYSLGIDVPKWKYFIENPGLKRSLLIPILKNGASLRNIGIILGALTASLFASEFKISKIRNRKEIVGAVLGGFLMGVGSRIASGCNVGAFFSAVMSFSLTGWIFGIAAFIGAAIGSKIFLNYIIKK